MTAVTPGTELLARIRQNVSALISAGDTLTNDEITNAIMRDFSATLARLAAKPADEGVREATIEECAKVADENASITAEDDSEIWIAKKIAAQIRKLSTTGAPKP